jgi:uncharacterized protein with ParB-like and HNH nuclease domain
MEAGKRSIPDIFNQGRTLEIPFFQRSYVWTDENWERFFNDMEAVSTYNKAYFLGSIILKTRPVSMANVIGDWRIVVDGQQRLTTITLFCKALCEVQEKLGFERIFFNMKNQIILQHNHSDIEIFEAIVQGRLTKSLMDKHRHSNILECYNFFKKRKEELKKLNLDTLFSRLYFVGIDLGSEEDEQQIFDTINSLGVALTTAELLKNELFHREDESFYEETWKKTFEKDDDIKEYWDTEVTAGREHRINIDLFLQSYLLIQSDAHDKYIGLSSLFSNYKAFIKDHGIQKHSFIEVLVTYADHYQNGINPDLLNEEVDMDSAIERLNIVVFGLNITTVVPYILYILKEVTNKEEMENIFRLLENYLMRRLICKETSKNYNNLFVSFIRNKINSYEVLRDKIEKAEDMTNRFPSDKALMKGFAESKLTNQQAKVALYLIEKSSQDKKDATIIRPFNEYSVEHIMPKMWRNHWKNLGIRDEDERDEYVRKMGNLTILPASLNSSVRDADWKTKKTGRGNKKGLEYYSKGIKIFEPYLKRDDWNEDVMKERATELCRQAISIWTLKTQ